MWKGYIFSSRKLYVCIESLGAFFSYLNALFSGFANEKFTVPLKCRHVNMPPHPPEKKKSSQSILQMNTLCVSIFTQFI